MIASSETETWYEVADSHPAARITSICRQNSSDPGKAAAKVLSRALKLEPLCTTLYDRFVLEGGWHGWRVLAPKRLVGRWVYTRSVHAERSAMWPPKIWQDCIARYELETQQKAVLAVNSDPKSGDLSANSVLRSDSKLSNSDGYAQTGHTSWKQRLNRDTAIVEAMITAMGTDSFLNPFCLLDHNIGRGVFKTTIEDLCCSYRGEGPGTRITPRALRMLLTQIGIRRATEYLVETYFINRAELWLHKQAEAGAELEELDRLEKQLLRLMDDRLFVWVARCCAIAAMCELDPDAAVLWYKTGGDSSGHPNIRTYSAQVREHLLIPSQ